MRLDVAPSEPPVLKARPAHTWRSPSEPDWTRETKAFWEWAPSRSLLSSLRMHHRLAGSRAPWHVLLRGVASLRHRFWSIVTASDIPLGARLGGGLLLPHPTGVVIHGDVEIGPNCLVFQGVTLGANEQGVPRIGGHVDIGAGAKVIGPITVGDHAQIGANAVVVCDVPPWATAVGVPARILLRAPTEGG